MLFVNVRRMEMFDGDIDSVFRNNYEDEWFDEPMVQNIITVSYTHLDVYKRQQ